MADAGADGMQGALWVRRARGKLLRSWTKRYFVLSPSGALREYAVDARSLRSKPGKPAAAGFPGVSGFNALTLRQELGVRGAGVKMIPPSSAGRQHAFQLTVRADASSASSLSRDAFAAALLCLSAASQEEMHRWLHALHRASLNASLSLSLEGSALARSSLTTSLAAVSTVTPSLHLPPPPPMRALTSMALASSSSSSGSPSSSVPPSPASLSPRSPPPSPSASEMEHAQYEDEFVDVSGVQRSDMAHLSAVYEWINECRVKTTRALHVGSGVGSALVPRGSLLVALNGSSLQTLTPDEIRSTLLEGKPVASLRFLRSPSKRGRLKCKTSSSNSGGGGASTAGNGSFSAQLKTMAQLRTSVANRMSNRMAAKETYAWREHEVELDGDVLTYALASDGNSGRSRSYHQALATTGNDSGSGVRRRLTTGHIGANASIFDSSSGGRASARRGKRSIVLTGGCSVKPMPERVADGDFCFSVSSSSIQSSATSSSKSNKPVAVVFQASSERDMRQWVNTLRRAIAISEGCIPALDREYIDALQRMAVDDTPQDTIVPRDDQFDERNDHAQSGDLFLGAIHEDVPAMSLSRAKDYEAGPPGFDEEDEDDTSGSDVNAEEENAALPAGATARTAPQLLETELSAMLLFLQTQGRFVEALQLVGRNTAMRGTYWREIFQWAGVHTAEASTDDQEDAHSATYHSLLHLPLSEEDEIQVQKDIPRTSKWLSGSAGAPELDDAHTTIRLEKLGRVLHAFLSSCALDEHQRAVADGARAIDTDVNPSRSFYMQGMNAIAFILLEVLEDDEVAAFEFLRGLVARVLPHVFGLYGDPLDDTPSASASAGVSGRPGDHFDLFNSLVEVGNVLQDVAQLHVPVFDAALERAGIPVCLLAYKWFPTLFSDLSLTAYHSQLRFDTMLVIWDACLLLGLEGLFAVSLALFAAAEDAVSALGTEASAEQVSWTVGSVLSRVPPEDLITSVCEVLELCAHPVVLKLRNAHRRRLQLGYAKAGHGFSEHDAAPSTAPGAAMTVTDLDSGQQFAISHAGNVVDLTQ